MYSFFYIILPFMFHVVTNIMYLREQKTGLHYKLQSIKDNIPQVCGSLLYIIFTRIHIFHITTF